MNKQIIKTALTEILENIEFDELLIEKYFSKEYIQHVDGKTIDYKNFKDHIRTLKAHVKSQSISINSIVEEGDIVFTNHIVTFTMQDGRNGQIKVIAEFRIKDDKIYYCDELTHMIAGDDKDRDLGSRIE